MWLPSGDDPVSVILRREIKIAEAEPTRRRASVQPRARTTCAVNGCLVPARVMRAVGSCLLDVNGQNAQVWPRGIIIKKCIFNCVTITLKALRGKSDVLANAVAI